MPMDQSCSWGCTEMQRQLPHELELGGELPPSYLDYEAMVRHHFVERNDQFLQYRLIFDRRCTYHVALPAHTFFDFQAKKRYFITREEANEYERRTEATRLQGAAHQAVAATSQYDPSYNFGYPPGHQWP